MVRTLLAISVVAAHAGDLTVAAHYNPVILPREETPSARLVGDLGKVDCCSSEQ